MMCVRFFIIKNLFQPASQSDTFVSTWYSSFIYKFSRFGGTGSRGGGRGSRGWGRGSRGWGRGSRGWGRGCRGCGRGSRGWGRGSRGWRKGSRGEGRVPPHHPAPGGELGQPHQQVLQHLQARLLTYPIV
jgi:hypothetical protein